MNLIDMASFRVDDALYERARALAETVSTEELHPESGPADPETTLARTVHHVKVWRNACTRVQFMAVRREDGLPLVGCAAAELPRAHWAPDFAPSVGRPEVEDELAQHLPSDLLADFGPHLEGFAAAILEGKRDTAPGPDVLRFTTWKAAGP